MAYQESLKERMTLVGTIDPASLAAATAKYSDVVDMKYHARALIAVTMGSATTTKMAATALTINVFECTSAGTAASTAIATATITRAQTTADTGQQVVLEVKDTDLGSVHAAYNRYFKVGVTPGSAAVQGGVVIFGTDSRYSKASSNDLATVTID